MCAYPLVLAKRKAKVHGIYSPGTGDKPFVGMIELELRQGAGERDKGEKSIYYIWRLEAPKGEWIWTASNGVSLRIIPASEDPFQFSLLHAIENIQRQRDGRKRVFHVEGYGWIKERRWLASVRRILTGRPPREMTSIDTVTLYRPVGPEELRLIAAAGWKKWPPRLPGQPIFYPVANERYAREIAEKWNMPENGAGYVTRFEVRKSFMDRYDIHCVGGSGYMEWWIPAEDLEELNANIVGLIEVIGEYSVVPVPQEEVKVQEMKEYEKQVARALLGAAGLEALFDVLTNAIDTEYDYTGHGYFLTLKHPNLPGEPRVLDKPMISGRAKGIEDVGFVAFLDDHEFTLECFSYGDGIPEDFRDWNVEIIIGQ